MNRSVNPENCIQFSSIVLFNALTYSSFCIAKSKNILAFSFLFLLGSDHEIFYSSGISSKRTIVLLINSKFISSRGSPLFCWILFFIGSVKKRVQIKNPRMQLLKRTKSQTEKCKVTYKAPHVLIFLHAKEEFFPNIRMLFLFSPLVACLVFNFANFVCYKTNRIKFWENNTLKRRFSFSARPMIKKLRCLIYI